jgi:hypothetical protein
LRSFNVGLAGAALAAILLSGCGGGNPVNTGPFGGSNYGGEGTCSDPLPPHSVFTDSDLAFNNTGPAAVIDKVSFTHIHGLRLVTAYTVLNLQIGGGFGDAPGPPPPSELARGILWSQRQRADGAHIPPTPKSDEVDLVLVMQLTSASGTFSGLNLYYHTRGGHYHMQVDRSLTLRTHSNQGCRP